MNNLLAQINRSHSSIRLTRARTVAENIINAQEILQRNLISQRRAANLRLQELLDFGPDETTSLRAVSSDFNPAAYVNTVHALKVQIDGLDRELAIANATLNSWTEEVPDAQEQNLVASSLDTASL